MDRCLLDARVVTKAIVVGAVVAMLGSIGAAAGDDVFFMPLSPEALPATVGANAFAVAGTFFSGGGFYWLPTTGARSIGGRSVVSISSNGSAIIGNALDARGLENAAVWQGGTTWQVLGSFSPNSQPCDLLLSGAFGASRDGRVIVGLGWDGCRLAHAFRWEASTGMVDLGSTTANSTRANGVSGDGRVVVGWQEAATGFRQGARWIDRKQELFAGPSGVVGEAFAANRDGSFIVGKQCDPASTTVSSAWTWTAAAGIRCYPISRPPTLPNLPYSTTMLATSDDGRVIGGSFTFGLDAESLLWLDGQGYFLEDYLRDHGYPDAFRGWVNTGFIKSVSPDGRTLVGFGAGPRTFQGFIVILPQRDSR